ncbi:hypothetical protein [uncultured Helicobacter sp.]|uniref:hypothetical protein n=1 Tax=uncultured Helicobacter sp. TaxID=175537 RepID=UPI003753B107
MLYNRFCDCGLWFKGASSNRVPDAIALRDSINLLKNAMYERVSRSEGALPHAPIAICQKVGL